MGVDFNPFPKREPLTHIYAEDVDPAIAEAFGLPSRNEAPKDDWPILSRDAFYGLAGDIACTIEPHTEADPAAILLQTLAAAGNLLGSGLHCKVEATRHPLLIFPVLVGISSKGRKGTSFAHVEGLFGEVDKLWARERIVSGLSSAEGLIAEVRDDAEHPYRPAAARGTA